MVSERSRAALLTSSAGRGQQRRVAEPLTIVSLERMLDEAGVDPASYRLDGAHEHECLVLLHGPMRQVSGGWIDTWSVFFSERGQEHGTRVFDNEDQACRHVLRLLTNAS